MKLALFAPLLLLSLSAAPAPVRLPLHVGGRVVAEGKALRFGWPGVYFEGRFRGTAASVSFVSGGDFFRVSIDGKTFQTLTKPGATEVKIGGLLPGIHLVRLDKLTESQTGSSRFLGFFTTGTPLAAPKRQRQIEFIGDSYSVGYGDTSAGRECSPAEVHDTTDTSQAFGPVLAKRLGADYRVIAYSGYGIVRNYAGKYPGDSMVVRYPRAIPGEPQPDPAGSGWRPQAIVINLGTNDFSTPLEPGEPWADDAALHAAYRARYATFVKDLKRRQPQARFVLMGAENFFPDVAAVAAATRATAVKMPALELTGCQWHPSLADHRAMADLLQKAIGRL